VLSSLEDQGRHQNQGNPMAKKPVSEQRQLIAAKMHELHVQMQQLEVMEIERIGTVAKNTGLIDLGLSNAELKEAFEQIVGRFQRSEQQTQASQATLS
jgi:hypothetical protein